MRTTASIIIIMSVLLLHSLPARCQLEEEELGPDLDPKYVNASVPGAGKCRDAILMMYMPALDEIRRLRASGKSRDAAAESVAAWFAKESARWRCEGGGTYKVAFDSAGRFRVYCTAHDLNAPGSERCESLRYPQGDLDGAMWIQAEEKRSGMNVVTEIVDVNELEGANAPAAGGNGTDEVIRKALAAGADPPDEKPARSAEATIGEIRVLAGEIKSHAQRLENLRAKYEAGAAFLRKFDGAGVPSGKDAESIKAVIEKMRALEAAYSYVDELKTKAGLLALSCGEPRLKKIFDGEVGKNLAALEKTRRPIRLKKIDLGVYERKIEGRPDPLKPR